MILGKATALGKGRESSRLQKATQSSVSKHKTHPIPPETMFKQLGTFKWRLYVTDVRRWEGAEGAIIKGRELS